MALGRQVIYFVRLHLLKHPDQVARIGEVAVMKDHLSIRIVRIFVKMVDAVRVEQGCPAFDAMDLIAFGQQQFCKVGAVLAGDAGDECFFHGIPLGWLGFHDKR